MPSPAVAKAERGSRGVSNREEVEVGTSLESLGDGEELVLRKYCGCNEHGHFLPGTLSVFMAFLLFAHGGL